MRTSDHDSHDTTTGTGPSHVPGGAARLPRLHGHPSRADTAEPGGCRVEVIGGGFVDDARPAGSPIRLSFADYSPTESLFEHPGRAAAGGGAEGSTDAAPTPSNTSVLGIAPDADWNTIRRAHRNLLAQLHPDRFVTADDRTRHDAAERLAAINIAYHELEKDRRAV